VSTKPEFKKKISHLHWQFDPWHYYAVSERRASITQWCGTTPQKNGDGCTATEAARSSQMFLPSYSLLV